MLLFHCSFFLCFHDKDGMQRKIIGSRWKWKFMGRNNYILSCYAYFFCSRRINDSLYFLVFKRNLKGRFSIPFFI